MAEAPPPETATTVQLTSCPTSWFRDPLDAAIKKLIRPSTALTRRKELEIKLQIPRDVFEDWISPLAESDAWSLTWDSVQKKLVQSSDTGLKRDSQGHLLPTRSSAAARRFEYVMKKGSVSDRLFHLQDLDPPPPAKSKERMSSEVETAQIGEDNVYEVEELRSSRVKGKRTQYQVKWLGWADEYMTWEWTSRVHPDLVAAFEGKPTPVPRRAPAAVLPKRGHGCARARLSDAEQRRGGVPQTISMVCGNVIIKLKESRSDAYMPYLRLIFYVLTMNASGHITWPTNFAAATKAALRMQVRAQLKKMIDDPLNPVDETMSPALTGPGSDSIFEPAKRRMLVVV